jgi:hypothetical protein
MEKWEERGDWRLFVEVRRKTETVPEEEEGGISF